MVGLVVVLDADEDLEDQVHETAGDLGMEVCHDTSSLTVSESRL